MTKRVKMPQRVAEGQDRPIQPRRFGECRYTRRAAGRIARHGTEADEGAASCESLRSRGRLRTYCRRIGLNVSDRQERSFASVHRLTA
jgi:hypothetical protein